MQPRLEIDASPDQWRKDFFSRAKKSKLSSKIKAKQNSSLMFTRFSDAYIYTGLGVLDKSILSGAWLMFTSENRFLIHVK